MIKCKRNYVYADMSDFTQIWPGLKLPWMFFKHQIQKMYKTYLK